MAYKFFNINLTLRNPTDHINEPISIYKAFEKRAGTGISSSNFNKYGPAANLRIEIRFNVINERALVARLQSLANTMSSTNRIQPTRISFNQWNEPDFVIEAHETATLCAVRFKEEIENNQQTLANLLADIDNFMWQFMIALLRSVGFQPNIIWGFLRHPFPQNIIDLARVCSPILLESIDEITPTSSYMERFVHCFYNCTISNKNKLLSTLQTSNIWQELTDSRTV